MAFEDDLLAVQAERGQALAREEQRANLETKLLAEAAERLVAAAQKLSGSGIALVEARLAHKDRGNWVWPAGRPRVAGWLLHCGDTDVMLRTDGWLAAAHRCDDPKRTLCACLLSRARSPVPPGVYLPAIEDGKESGIRELVIRTTLAGSVQDLPFNRWLAEQVADCL